MSVIESTLAPAVESNAGQAAPEPTPANTFSVSIEKLVYGGEGLARKESGEVCFVPYSVPGDEVIAEQLPGPAKPLKAKILSITKPSADRVDPLCEVFGTCGGCQWQHIESSVQQHWKTSIVEESLRRLGGLKDVVVEPILRVNPNPEDPNFDSNWRYRNRVQWDVKAVGDSLQMGYVQAQTHALVAFSDCRIISESMNDFYQYMQAMLKSALFLRTPKLGEALRRVEVTENVKGESLVTLYGSWHPGLPTLASQIMGERNEVQGISFIDLNRRLSKTRTLSGKGSIEHKLGDYRFQVSAGSFFQTNTAVANLMLSEAQKWLPEGTESLLDLYAGGAVFAIGLHDKATEIFAVESAAGAVADANSNLKLNKVENVTILEAPVDHVLKGEKRTFDAVILDPPRAGSSPHSLEWLATHITDRMLYISCNPTTLARDLKQLVGLGWTIERVQPIELFPQTYHIETMVQLKAPGTNVKVVDNGEDEEEQDVVSDDVSEEVDEA